MRKRILFRKSICCLLALLLALSSLATLSVFAAGIDEDSGEGSTAVDVDLEEELRKRQAEEEEAKRLAEEEEAKRLAEEEEAAKKLAEEEEAKEPVEEEKPEEPAEEEETKEPAEEEETKEPAEEEKPEEPVEEETIMTPASAAKIPEPVSLDGDALLLYGGRYSHWYRFELSFSDAPYKAFRIDVSGDGSCTFTCDWQEIHDSRVKMQVIPPANDFGFTIRLPFDFLAEYGINLSKDDRVAFDQRDYSLAHLDLPEGEKKEDKLPGGQGTGSGELKPYTGITIDGDFSDWDSVPKYDIDDGKSWSTVDQAAVVWDGDTIYMLLVSFGEPCPWDPNLRQGRWNAICGAGSHSMSNFVLKTDLGGETPFRAVDTNNQPGITGLRDVKLAYTDLGYFSAPFMWEFSFPDNVLCEYKNSFTFGFAQGADLIRDITNLHPPAEVEDKSPAAITVDGNFEDWKWHPRTRISYSTNGTHETEEDAEGALWSSNGILYGYVRTNMNAHLQAQGGEFLAGISIAFNSHRGYIEYPKDGNFYPQIIDVSNGSVQVLNEGTRLSQGAHTFYINDRRIAPPSTVSEVKEKAFGQMIVVVNGEDDKAEWWLDLKKIAALSGVDASSFGLIEAQYIRLGTQWVTYAGTPTGPILGLTLCLGTVGGTYMFDRRKKKKKAAADGESEEHNEN